MAEEKLSFGEEIPKTRRETDFVAVTIRVEAPAETVFSIVVSKTWKRIPPPPAAPGDRSGWRALDGFAPSNTATIQLFQVSEPYEVNLKDWLEYQASLLSLSLTALQYAETERGPLVHAAGTMDRDRVRVLVCADGPNIFVLVGRAARSERPEMDAVLGLAAASFLFRKHSGVVSREKLDLYIDNHKIFRLLHPESWKPEPRPEDRSHRVAVDFRIAAAGDTAGYIGVTADTASAKRAELKTVFENTIQELASAGITVEKLEAIPAGPGGGDRERWLGDCKLPSGRGQVALLFRRGEIGWLTAVMLAPEKTANPMAWMRAKRFYEILTMTLGASEAKDIRPNFSPKRVR